MTIEPQSPASGASGTSSVDSAQSAQVADSQKPVAPEPNDTVQLSSGQATVGQLIAQLNQIPDIRHEQVSALRSAIDSGRYDPSNSQVADALVAHSFGASEQA